jgi:hypothetical protein
MSDGGDSTHACSFYEIEILIVIPIDLLHDFIHCEVCSVRWDAPANDSLSAFPKTEEPPAIWFFIEHFCGGPKG